MNERGRKWKRNNDKYSNSSRNWDDRVEREKRDKSRTYNLLDIKEAVEIKPQDYSKSINTKEFQFVQKPKDGTQNWEVGGAKLPREATLPKAPSDRVVPKQKKGMAGLCPAGTTSSSRGKGLRSRYGLA